MYRLIVMTVGVAVAIAFVVGCGSGDEATSADEVASAPLTKAQFIEQADAICEDAAKEREADIASWKKELPGGQAEVVDNLDEGVRQILAPSMQRQAKELEALAPPLTDEDEVSRMIGTLAKAGNAFAQEGAKAYSRPETSQFEREAADYGLKACGSLA